MDHLLKLFHLEHGEDLLDVDIHMLQNWLVVAPTSKFHTVSTTLFHKYGGANIAVTNCMSQFSMFVPTNSIVKLANGNMEHDQLIGILLCSFINCSIIYPVVSVYYCTGHTYNNISSGALKFYVGFQKFTYEPVEHCDFVDPQGRSWRSTYQTQNNLKYIQIKICQGKLS